MLDRLGQLKIVARRLEFLVIRIALVEFHGQFLHDGVEVALEILAHQEFRDMARHRDMRIALEFRTRDVRGARLLPGIVHLHVIQRALEQERDKRVARLVIAQLLEFLFPEKLHQRFMRQDLFRHCETPFLAG